MAGFFGLVERRVEGLNRNMKTLVNSFSLCVVAIGLLSGCAQRTVGIAIDSSPKGAVVYNARGNAFSAPAGFAMEVTEKDRKSGVALRDITVQWPSGMRKTEQLSIKIQKGEQYFVIQRPPGGKGEKADREYGLALEHLQIQQAMANAQIRAAAAQANYSRQMLYNAQQQTQAMQYQNSLIESGYCRPADRSYGGYGGYNPTVPNSAAQSISNGIQQFGNGISAGMNGY